MWTKTGCFGPILKKYLMYKNIGGPKQAVLVLPLKNI